MLPVQVRVLSSASCTLSQASALLERFLSSDACSDSFATDYVANVAQALHDSISRRVGGPEHTKHRHFSASSELPKQLVDVKQSAGNPAPHSKLHSHGNKILLTSLGHKQSLPAAEDAGQDAVVAMEVGSAMPDAEGAFKRHKKKRRHSAVENGLEMVPPSASEMEDSAYKHHDRKRRKKEKHERGTEDYGPDDQKHHDKRKGKEEQEIETENAVTEYPAPDSQHLHDKKRRKKEKQGRYTEDMETTENRDSPGSLLVDENLVKKSAYKAKKKVEVCNKLANNAVVSVTPLSSNLEEQAGSSKRKRKEDKAFLLATPFKVPFLEKNREETAIEASPLEFESLASKEKKETKKKKRRKEELGELVKQSLSG